MRFQKAIKINNISRKGEEKNAMKSSNRNKLLMLPFVAIFVLLLGAFGVSATIDCNITSISTINQLTKINVTFNVSEDASTKNTTVAFEMRDTTNHINSSYSLIANVSNTTGQRWTNLTVGNNILFPDADSADLRATCYQNASSVLIETATATAISNIVVDRSAPVTQGLSSPASGAAINLYTVTFGVVNSSRWRLFHNGIVVQTTTVTSDIANSSQQNQQISLRDSGSYYVETSDGTNTTNSQTISYTMAGGLIKSSVSKQAETKKVIEQKKVEKQEKSNKGILFIGVAVIIFVVVAGVMMSPKVRRKRR